MRRFYLLFACALLLMPAAAKKKVVNVWPKKKPADVTLREGKMRQEMAAGNILCILDMPVPTLEKFEAPNGDKDKVLIICPGGSYQMLAINHEGTEVAEWLNSLGYTAYILRYRVPNERDGALQDAQRAVRMVRAANPGKKVGLIGFSAGASLSARTATRFNLPSYTPTEAMDTLSARPDFVSLIYPAYLDLGENQTLTPELTVSAETPPMFIFQTADDPFGGSALVMSQALRNAKVPVELHLYPVGGHGYGLRPQITPVAAEWPRLMEQWLTTLP